MDFAFSEEDFPLEFYLIVDRNVCDATNKKKNLKNRLKTYGFTFELKLKNC